VTLSRNSSTNAYSSTASDGLTNHFQTPISRHRRVIIESDSSDDEDLTHLMPGAYPPSNPNTPEEHTATPSVQRFPPSFNFDTNHPPPLAQRPREYRFMPRPAQPASPSPGGQFSASNGEDRSTLELELNEDSDSEFYEKMISSDGFPF